MTIWTAQKVLGVIQVLMSPAPRYFVKHGAIMARADLSGRQVAAACTKLVEHGYLKRETYASGKVKPGCYLVTKLGLIAMEDGTTLSSGPQGPTGKPKIRANSLRERAWRVLRIRRKASVPELAGLLLDAGTADVEVERAHNNLSKYLRHLVHAGYLTEMRREAPQSLTSNGAKRFLLVRDTGPLPPVPQPALKKVFDQNEGKQYGIEA
ncbi:MAG: hypothetical protein H7Z39_04225 [Burkholderiaceae bacterium]|nr:hypothetical protein [Burkholderiaceae bacterium]